MPQAHASGVALAAYHLGLAASSCASHNGVEWVGRVYTMQGMLIGAFLTRSVSVYTPRFAGLRHGRKQLTRRGCAQAAMPSTSPICPDLEERQARGVRASRRSAVYCVSQPARSDSKIRPSEIGRCRSLGPYARVFHASISTTSCAALTISAPRRSCRGCTNRVARDQAESTAVCDVPQQKRRVQHVRAYTVADGIDSALS